MEGYSIKEAAAVLGIPKRRVRDLVARGVLTASSQQDGSLRVHLQPSGPDAEPIRQRPAPGPSARPSHAADPAGYGPGMEGSPFRELLTEFRHLTERYGQALLALGEARGEVASLRGRIERLEARMDLSLPAGRPETHVTDWRPAALPASASDPGSPEALVTFSTDAAEESAPPPEATAAEEEVVAEAELAPEPTVEPEPEAPVAAEGTPKPEVEQEAEPRPKLRLRGPRLALEGIADALARAVDPSSPILEVEATEAVTAYQATTEASEAQAVQADETAEPIQPPDEFADLLAVDGIAVDASIDEEVVPVPIDEPAILASPALDEAVEASEEEGLVWLDAVETEPEDGLTEAVPPSEPPLDSAIDETEPEWPEDWIEEESDPFVAWEPAPEPEEAPVAAEAEQARAPEGEPEPEPDPAGDTEPMGAELQPGPAGDNEPMGAEPEPEPELEPAPGPEPEPLPAEAEPQFEPEPVAQDEPEPVKAVAEPEPWSLAAEAEPVFEPEPVAEHEPEPAADAMPVEEDESSAAGQEEPAGEVFEQTAIVEAEAADEPAAQERAIVEEEAARAEPGADEVELLWLGPQDEPAPFESELEIAAAGWQEAETEASGQETETDVDEHLARIAEDQGWEPSEVEAMRLFLEQPDPLPAGEPKDAVPASQSAEPAWPKEDSHPSWSLPGARELDEALAALRPSSVQPSTPPPSSAPQSARATEAPSADPLAGERRSSALPPVTDRPEEDASASPSDDDTERPRVVFGSRGSAAASRSRQWAKPSTSPSESIQNPPPTPPAAQPRDLAGPHHEVARQLGPEPESHPQLGPHGEPEWLRGRRDPAARAYRRLRRIFPS
jgi:hypothetical protein